MPILPYNVSLNRFLHNKIRCPRQMARALWYLFAFLRSIREKMMVKRFYIDFQYCFCIFAVLLYSGQRLTVMPPPACHDHRHKGKYTTNPTIGQPKSHLKRFGRIGLSKILGQTSRSSNGCLPHCITVGNACQGVFENHKTYWQKYKTYCRFLIDFPGQERPFPVSPVLFFGDYSQELAFKNYEKVEKSDFFKIFQLFFEKVENFAVLVRYI